jgi:hypothetical protein
VSTLTADFTISKTEFTSYIDGVGNMFLADQDNLSKLKQVHSITGAEDPDVKSSWSF